MQLKIQISLALAILLSLGGHVKADCNVCSATFPFACVAQDKVRLCVDGSPSGDVLFCGEGNLCDIDGICRPADQVTAVSCDECNTCDANRVFACTSPTSFALCLGNEKPSDDITGECREGYVCSRNSKEICTLAVNGATCPFNFEPPTEAPPTAPPAPPNPETHPNEFCTFMGQATRYPVGTDQATSCRRYIQCFDTPNGWVGAQYLCAGGTYFQDNVRGCQTTLPLRCGAAVRSLNFSP